MKLDKNKLIIKGSQIREIQDIGKRIEISVSSFFNNKGESDPTKNFTWDYILVDNDKIVKSTIDCSNNEKSKN